MKLVTGITSLQIRLIDKVQTKFEFNKRND